MEADLKQDMMDESLSADLEFAQSIGPMLDELRKKQLLCDTIFKVEAKHFHVHRCVLAATSPYFKTMFTEDWAEGQESIVDLPDAKECGFEQVLRFAYTGHAELNKENIEDVLMSANHYCYPALNELCVKYMLATIDENNCLLYMKLAEMYDAKNVLEKADEMVLNNYSTVVQDAAFLNISKDAFCQFLVSDKLHQNTSELEIFQSVCTWLTHQTKCITLVTDLMQHIRFDLFSTEELREHVFKNELVRQDKLCMDLVLDKILVGPCANARVMPHQHASANMETKHLFILSSKPNMILAGKVNEDAGVNVNNLPTIPDDVSKYKGITYEKFLFLVLNKNDVAIDTARLLRYDVTVGKWEHMSGMEEDREDFTLTVFGGSLIVIGGLNKSGIRVASAEQYIIATDTWQEFYTAPHVHDVMAACVCDGSLYISGGSCTEDGGYLADMYVHCPDTQEWRALDPVPIKLEYHNLVSMGSNIYAICITPPNCFQFRLYQVDSKQWTILGYSGIKTFGIRKGAAVYKNVIYASGQCRDHSGKCLLCLEHVNDDLIAHCVKTIDEVANMFWIC